MMAAQDNRVGRLVNLEAERVHNQQIREAYNRCDINNLNPMKLNIRSFEDLLNYYF